MFIKDAFLVFRALCKLTMKPLNTERYAFNSFIKGDDVNAWPASVISNLML